MLEIKIQMYNLYFNIVKFIFYFRCFWREGIFYSFTVNLWIMNILSRLDTFGWETFDKIINAWSGSKESRDYIAAFQRKQESVN